MLKRQEQEILDCFTSNDEVLDKFEIAERLGVGQWGVYPYIRNLESLGLLNSGGFRRDKRKVYYKADMSTTPRVHFQGTNQKPVSIWEIARRAKTMTDAEQPIIGSLQALPVDLLILYKIAARISYGHEFERKEFLALRNRLMTLKTRLENYVLAINELLNHPALSTDPKQISKTLMQDPANPLTYEEVIEL